MAREATKEYRWSAWHLFDAEVANTSVPDKPGVYEVRADFEFGRLKGSSPVVTIGSAVASLRKRLCEQRFRNTLRYQNRAEKWLAQAGHKLEFRYTTTDSGKEARYLEALRLMEYENEHWELPPGNEVLPLSVIRKHIQEKYGRLTEKPLKHLLEHYQSLDEVARVLAVPPKVVSNLMVYWGVR